MKKVLFPLMLFCAGAGFAAALDNPVDIKLRDTYRRLHFAQQYPTNAALFIQAQLQDAKLPLDVMPELAKDKQGPVRILLAMLLGEYGESDGAKILWPMTLDELESVRLTAAGSLIRLSHLTSIPINPAGLDDERPTVRRLTASTFAGIRDKSAESSLLGHVLNEKDELVQADIVKALHSNVCGTDKSLSPLLQLLHQSASVEVRQNAAHSVGSIHDPVVVDPLINAAVKDSDWHVRASATLELGGWVKEKPDAINTLVNILENENFALVRDRAADSLIPVVNDEKALAALLHAIGDNERSVRFHAVRAIIDGKASNALLPLTEMRHHSDPNVREAVMDIFGKIGGLDQIPFIVEATSDSEPQVQLAAVRALHLLKDRGGVQALISQLTSQDPHLRAAAARALGEMGDKSITPKILLLLRDDYGYVRGAAAEALGKLGDRAAIAPLIQMLAGEKTTDKATMGLIIGDKPKFAAELELTQTQAKIRATDALGVLAAPEAVDALIQFGLKDKDPQLRAASAYALGRTRDLRAVEPLIDVVTPYYSTETPAASGMTIYSGAGQVPDEQRRTIEKEARVRASVAYALGQIADPRAAAILQKALEDQNSLVRDAASEALARIVEKQEREEFAASSTNANKTATGKKP